MKLATVKVGILGQTVSANTPHLHIDFAGGKGGSYLSRVPVKDMPKLIEAARKALLADAKRTGYTSAPYVEAKNKGLI